MKSRELNVALAIVLGLLTGCQKPMHFPAVSLPDSAKAVGANPYEYLHDVYNRIMAHPVNRLHELLPAAWMRARSER